MTFSEKSQCSGCSACKYACSTGSIMMQRDEEGFLYPSIDPDTCVNCGKCVNACPIKSPHLDSAKPFTQLACQNVNDNCRMNSTSGGMFSAIAELVISRGGTVFAAEYGVSCRVVHSAAHKIEDLENMRMSKYVQSDMQETIAQLHSEVERDVPVFFIGTPCQTEGVLQSFAGEIPDNLFTADLVCYGVPSPGLYDRWIESIKRKYNADVVEIRFRDKKYGYAGTNIKIVLNNGKIIEDCKEAKSFVKTMFSHIGLRPSCYNCPFRGRPRRCDFTLGDFFEINNYAKNLNDDKGTTLLSVYTEKGRNLFSSISDVRSVLIKDLDVGEAAEYWQRERMLNKQIGSQRESFFIDSQILAYDDLMEKYFPLSGKERCALILKPVIKKLPGAHLFFRLLKVYKVKKYNKNVCNE